MIKRDKKKSAPMQAMWLITFSDLMTLLLTFFVLLLSMSSMDRSYLTKVAMFTEDLGLLTYRGGGRVPTKTRLIIELMENPREALEKQKRLKDLLFPDDVLPSEIDRLTLDENLEILAKPEGVALSLSDKLLFKSGEAELSGTGRKLLAIVADVMGYMTAPVDVAGYADLVGGQSWSNYVLSGRRAMSVLEYFVEFGIDSRRLSVSAYGPNFPVAGNDTEKGRARNRRVEILMKTTPQIGGYY